MFGFSKKKKKKEEDEKTNGKLLNTQTCTTQEFTVHSSVTSSYKVTREITTKTTDAVSLSNTLSGLQLANRNTSLSSSLLHSSNTADRNTTLTSSILNRSTNKDAQPFRRISVPSTSTSSIFSREPLLSSNSTDALPFKQPATASSTYRSVYTREPFSTYRNRVPSSQIRSSSSTSSVPSSTSSTTNSILLPNPSYIDKTLKIKVIKTGKVYDEGEHIVPIYKTSSKNRGKVLVINNIKFLNQKQERQGAEIDEKNIVDLFKQMGMKVVPYRDKTKAEMEKIITNYRKDSSLKQIDINIVVIMSHGTGHERHDSTEVVGIDDNLLPTTWILEQFANDNCPQLSNKPKIFIFQCCRGPNKDTMNTIQHDTVSFVPQVRKFADMLIAYSTVPGFVSHRDPKTGTWYIQTICEVFMNHAHDKDVESMLKIVDQKLENIVHACSSRQTTSFENRGFKTCYLHPKP